MKLYGKSNSAAVLILALLVPTAVLTAQSDNASVSGVVRDPSGAVVPAARVALTDERTALERRTTTNPSGYYIFTSIPPGFYSISAEASGFKTTQQTNNNIVPSTAANIDLTLQVGGVSETVSVVASAAAVQEDSGTLGRVVDRDQVLNTQLNGRNPLVLAQLMPGVNGLALNGLCFDNGTCGAYNMWINGARPSDTMIYNDGAPAQRSRWSGFSIGTMDPDNVQEMQVLTAGFRAEFGGVSGAQIRMVSRGGGRDFHGALYEFLRNSAFDANTWARNHNADPSLSSHAAPYKFNQFGYNVGGPVYIPGKWNRDRNKLFFLFGQEYVRYRQDQNLTLTVPSRQMRTGDFSQLVGPNSFFANGVTIKDPLTGIAFPRNVIPQDRLSKNGIGLLNEFPLPTLGFFESGTNWYSVGSAWKNQRKDTLSIDFNPQEKHQIRFRTLGYNMDYYQPFFQSSDRVPSLQHWPNRTASVNYVWTINPTTVNEMLVSASKDRVMTNLDLSSGRAFRTQYGINFPYVFPASQKDIPDKIPMITVTGFSTITGSKFPSHSSGPIYQISDNLTKIHGNHTLKFGALFDRTGENDMDQVQFGANVPGGTDNQNGGFTFTNTRAGAPTSGVAIANAALGLFDTYAEFGTRAYTPYRSQMYEWFAQDGWKVTSRLRVDIGIRQSIIQPYYSLWNNTIYFDPTLYDATKRVVQDPKTGYILSGQDFNGMVIPGNGWPSAAKGRVPIADSGQYNYLFRNYPRGFSDTHSLFQPRAGFAYQISRGQVLRSGGGRFIQRPHVSDAIFPGGQAPYQPMVSLLNGNVDNPAAGSTGIRFPLQAFTQDRVFRPGEAYNWNVTYEREMPLQTMLQLSYVGRRGLHNYLIRNINQLAPGTVYANPGVNANTLRPYGGYYSIIMGDPNGSSKYKSFQLNWTRRFYKGLSYSLAYTYSQTYDDGSDRTSALPNAYDRRAVWGPSVTGGGNAGDTPHIVMINYIYELPFLKARKSLFGKVAGGWSLSGTSQFQSGKPVNIVSADDFAGVGPGSANQFWVMNGDPTIPSDQQKFSSGSADKNYWFRVKNPDGTSVFTQPKQGTFAANYNVGAVRQPGFQNWNIGLMKNFRLTERQKIRFQAESFNWINHPNWSAANITPTAAMFGKVSGKSSERGMQFALRYSF